jgi:hypothetical protein
VRAPVYRIFLSPLSREGKRALVISLAR